LTRLKASDRAHRLGSLAVNGFPGDPGASGYRTPFDLLLTTSGGQGADPGASIDRSLYRKLHERYDLIGFDRRGVGYSTEYSCPRSRGRRR
jgi:pimeloyl-ACP methyl ester carboxylesterase